MSYCTNCGQPYTRPVRYCSKCGLNLGQASGSFASDSLDASSRALASERSYWHIRRKNRDLADSNDSLRMYLGGLAAVAFVHGTSLFVPSFAQLLSGPLVWLFVAIILAGATFKFIFDLRYGYSPLRSLTEIILFGLICYGVMFGLFWYLSDFVHSGKPLFQLQLPATPTPQR